MVAKSCLDFICSDYRLFADLQYIQHMLFVENRIHYKFRKYRNEYGTCLLFKGYVVDTFYYIYFYKWNMCVFKKGGGGYLLKKDKHIVWILGTEILLIKILKTFRYKTELTILATVLSLCFFPYLLLVTYLYGTTVGMFFILLSYYQTILFQYNGKYRYAVGGIISANIAVQLKSNFKIFITHLAVKELIKIVSGGRVSNWNIYDSVCGNGTSRWENGTWMVEWL